jgi:tetratricopeptide (TPR) repeat protein/transcriptional regulator with XRE-family HTH domain
MNVSDSEPQPRLRLTEARNDCRMSQQQVADRIGTTHVNISRWERGITKPNPYFRRKLCKLFGKTEEELDLITLILSNQSTDPIHPSTPPSSHDTNYLLTNSAHSAVTTEPLPSPALYDPTIPLQPAIRLVGREGDLAKIKRRLRSGGNVALTALNGLPGVGKTALSVTLAHDPEILEHFRDGILWAGLGPTPNIDGLLSRWGSLLGISATEMASLNGKEAWAKAIHNAIGSRSMLLVIDDAWKLEEALTFKVGGPNCAHLLTTRFRDIAAHVAIEGATEIEALTDEEGMALLRLLAPGVVDREAQKAYALVHAVGGLPLALTLMGNYLRKQAYSGQARRITAALERLSHAEERLHISEARGPVETHPSLPGESHLSLHSVIAVTDQLLSEEARAALYALSVFPPRPNSFSEEAALVVAACTVDELDMLIDSGLLESSGSGRYSLHQTIADYARLHLEGTFVAERLIDYMLDFVEENHKDYDLLEQESHIILAALEKAYELDKKAELVQIITQCVPFMLSRGFYALAAKHLQRAHEAAMVLGNEYDITTTLLYLGEVTQQQGNFEQAEATFQEGLTLARKIDDRSRISAFLNDLGWVTWKQGNLTQAEKYLQEGLTIARQMEDKERICGILKVLGSVVAYMGNLAQSEEYLQEGLALARLIGDDEQTCLILINLGATVGEQGKYTHAENYFQEGLKLARLIGHRERISALLANLGESVAKQGNYEQAEHYFLEGLRMARQIEHREWATVLLLNLGTIAQKSKSYLQAEKYLQEGLDLARQIDIPQLTAYTLYEYGNLHLNQQQISIAENAYQEMISIVAEGNQDIIALAQYGLARVALAHGSIQEARRLGKKSATELETIGHHDSQIVKDWLASIAE